MNIEKNKIRLLFYTCSISIVLILLITQSTIFIRSSKAQSSEKIEQIVSSIYDLKKIYIKDLVNITIQDIDIERKLLVEENRGYLRSMSVYIKNLSKEIGDSQKLFDYLKEDKFCYKYMQLSFYNKLDNKIDYRLNSESQSAVYESLEEFEDELNDNSIYTYTETNDYYIYLYIDYKFIEDRVKEIMAKRIREKKYVDEGYIWVNEVIDYHGGQNYAIRRIHPNLPNTEGMFLSTNQTDINGNLPYKMELEGINASGEIFYEYYFKKMNSDKIESKLSYAKLYEPYDWIIATGVYLDDIDQIVDKEVIKIKKVQENLFSKIAFLTFICLTGVLILVVISEKMITGMILKFQNIVNEKNKEIMIEKKLIEEIAYLDPLTSLINRRAMNNELEKSFNLSCCNKETFSVIIGDIDFFKKVNDKYGHMAGDLVIKTISNILLENVNSFDYVSRWGGEEFLILLNYSNTEESINRLNRIIEEIREAPISFEGQDIKCTLSFGIASYTSEFDSIEGLIKKADKNLYKAKMSGRNKIVY